MFTKFKKCCISNALDVSEDDVLWEDGCACAAEESDDDADQNDNDTPVPSIADINLIFIPPANEVAGVYSDPYVRPSIRSFVRPSVRPSQSLIRYSSKTTKQNFMKLSGIVHYMMPYCTSYFKFLSA